MALLKSCSAHTKDGSAAVIDVYETDVTCALKEPSVPDTHQWKHYIREARNQATRAFLEYVEPGHFRDPETGCDYYLDCPDDLS